MDTTIAGHGLRWTTRLHRRPAPALVGGRSGRGFSRVRRRRPSMRQPEMRSNAGRRVRAATIVSSTASDGADGHAVEEREAQGEHAQQGDDHGGRGEHDGAPGGVEGADRGLLASSAAGDLGAVASEHEQRVVDAHAEADELGELGREVRRVDHVRPQGDQPDGRAEGEHRREDRNARGHHRPEREEQHDHRRRQADQARGARSLLTRELGALPAHLHLERAGGAVASGGHHVLEVVELELVHRVVVGHRRHRHAPVGGRGQLPDRLHVRQAPHLRERRLGTGLERRVLQGRPGAASREDDLVGVALLGWEALRRAGRTRVGCRSQTAGSSTSPTLPIAPAAKLTPTRMSVHTPTIRHGWRKQTRARRAKRLSVAWSADIESATEARGADRDRCEASGEPDCVRHQHDGAPRDQAHQHPAHEPLHQNRFPN